MNRNGYARVQFDPSVFILEMMSDRKRSLATKVAIVLASTLTNVVMTNIEILALNLVVLYIYKIVQWYLNCDTLFSMLFSFPALFPSFLVLIRIHR